MSNAPSTFDAQRTTGTADESTTGRSTLGRSVRETVATPFRFVGFWSAVLLPLAYVPMLTSGVAASRPSLFVILMAAHAAALFAGHDHRSD